MLDTVSVLYNEVLHSRYTDKCHYSFFMYRYMIQQVRQSRRPVGFLDPHLVSEQSINADASFVQGYITRGLIAHTDKEYVMVPFNQG